MTDTGRALATDSAPQWLGVEADTGQRERFTELDHAAASVLAASFAGRTPVNVDGPRAVSSLEFADDLPGDAVTYLRSVFDVEAQQAKGAWWLPEIASVKAGIVNVPAYMLTAPRWAMTTAAGDDLRIDLRYCPDGFATWALLNPLADMLCAPLWLRGPLSGKQEPAARDAAWATVDQTYAELGLTESDVAALLTVMRPGNGWSRLSPQHQMDAKQQLVAAVAPAVNTDLVRRWRAAMLRPLVERYYAKSKKGPALSKTVLTKAFQPTVAAFFGGDWLAFLDYLGEPLAAGDAIATSLPQARLYVQASAKVEQVAASKGLPIEQVAEVLASYLGTDGVRSPIERRVSAMTQAWEMIDSAHAAQRPGMTSLTELLRSESRTGTGPAPFQQPLFTTLFPTQLRAEVNACWGQELHPRYPDRTVSAFAPIRKMEGAFGVVLRLWHQLGLTCWSFCEEGLTGRSGLEGLADMYSREIAILAAMGTPVDPGLFEELAAAEARLGPLQTVVDSDWIVGQRRDGFEILRDILTRHRRAWAEQHLDAALRHQWEMPLREVSRQLNRALAARSAKMPTHKQLATMAESVANHWFGGDLSAMFAALGEPSPLTQKTVHFMPEDRVEFANLLYKLLGGQPVPEVRDEGYRPNYLLLQATHSAAQFVQLRELLDRVPDENDFPMFARQHAADPSDSQWYGPDLAPLSPADRLARFSAAVRTAVQQLTGVDIGEADPGPNSEPATSALDSVTQQEADGPR